MKIELNSKLLQAVSGLFLLAIAIVWMACGPFELYAFSWLPGLFLLLGALSLAGASYLGKMDGRLATKAVFYLLYAILFFTVEALILDYYFLSLWAMIEGAWLVQGAAAMRKNGEKNWFVPVGLGALVVVLAFVNNFVDSYVMTGVVFLFVALGQMLPFVNDYLPKIDIEKK
jgi:uncharacterized membrane protein HdeD (DUF308 family)